MSPQTPRLDRNLRRGKEIHFQVDGQTLIAFEGETIAAALLAAGHGVLRHTPKGEPRGVFCGMGVCFDCMVTVDGGRNVRACITPVRDGMHVNTIGDTPTLQDRS